MSIDSIENCYLMKEMKAKITDKFLNYDKLRSGHITVDIFFKILSSITGQPLSNEEQHILLKKYGQNKKTLINWQDFINNIGESFKQNENIEHIKAFPKLSDLNDENMLLLVKTYNSKIHPGYVNYFKFDEDLKQLSNNKTKYNEILNSQTNIEYENKNWPEMSQQMLVDRIKCAVYRRRIRVMDFFIDYDKLHYGVVTENNFVSAILAAIGKEAKLTRSEAQLLANYFRSKIDLSKICYLEFCKDVDSPFQTRDLEKDPLKRIETLPNEIISRPMQDLNAYDEVRVAKLLEEIKHKVETRRILTYPYFKDYDMAKGLTQVITRSQFARVLHFLDLDISEEDCRQLCFKFSDVTQNEVYYSKFCETVDNWFVASVPFCSPDTSNVLLQTHSEPNSKCIGDSLSGQKISRCDWLSIILPKLRSAGDDWPVEVILNRIRHLVLVNRISLKPWFHDFDQLRTGFITKSRFQRCLTHAGLTRLQLHDLTPAQMEKLITFYSSKKDPNMVNWINFINDIDTVFTLPELEKEPLVRVPAQEKFLQPRCGTIDWSMATQDMKDIFDMGMLILRQKIHERRMLLKPDFAAFDHLHRGLVGVDNFRQLVSMCGFNLTQEAIDAIILRFSNDDGFDYLDFLDNLDPFADQNDEYKYPERLELLRKTNISKNGQKNPLYLIDDAESILDAFKAEVYRKRIRLNDVFQDFDKLNHGYLPRITFRRCLGMLPLVIDEKSLSVIEDRYKGPQFESINWRAFCFDIEKIFQTPDLEKDPLKNPNLLYSENEVDKNCLDDELLEHVHRAINKIAVKVKERRMQLLPLFKDFDETHRLTVTQNQFRRVLMSLDLANVLGEREWLVLFRKYRHKLGITDNVNYQAFIDDVYKAAGMDIHMP